MAKKTVNEIAIEVIQGQWGSGDVRKQGLTKAGYNYDEVQKQVNAILAARAKVISNMNTWAKKIAADNRYHYVTWTSAKPKTKKCPICDNHSPGEFFGWNCIGFSFAVWHHGGGLSNNCNCGVISNQTGEKILSLKTDAEALKLAKSCIGLNDITIIRNKNGIPKSQWQAGDICLKFDGSVYKHTFYYMGNGQIADSSQRTGDANDIAVRNYKNYTCKVIFRWVGASIKLKTIDELAKEVLAGKWGSGDERKKRLTAAGYDYDAVQKRVNELVIPEKKTYNGILPTIKLVKTNAEVIADTIKWATWIANDNRFHYGGPRDSKYNGHKNGCYFCGTNLKIKPTGMVDRQYSYCCNPFVGAAWAHGGCVPAALKLCQKGSSWGFGKNSGYAKSSLFTNLGHPAKSKLKAGDVLCRDTHVALYIGNGKIVEAGGSDDNKRNSAKWNNSIRIRTLTDSNYKNFPRVHRFNGSVNTEMYIRHGEVSKRVAQWQAFLDWYFDGKVGAADGYFGDNTLKWTKKFQEEQIGKGQGDGIIGPKTLEAATKTKK